MMCICRSRTKTDHILLSRPDYPALAGADNPPPAENFWIGPDLPWQNRSGTRVAILLILACKEQHQGPSTTRFPPNKMHPIQKERDEVVTLTHWRKIAEEKIPGGEVKKIRGEPGESGGRIDSGGGGCSDDGWGAEVGLGEDWLLCLSLPSPTQPIRG